MTRGEIALTTFENRLVKDTPFQVVTEDLAYNIILWGPWIRDMDVVPSTLYQVIKFPSNGELEKLEVENELFENVTQLPL